MSYLDGLLARTDSAFSSGSDAGRAAESPVLEPMARPSDQLIGHLASEELFEQDDVAAAPTPHTESSVVTGTATPTAAPANAEQGRVVEPRPESVDAKTSDVVLPAQHPVEQADTGNVHSPEQTPLPDKGPPPDVTPAPVPVISRPGPPVVPKESADQPPETIEQPAVRSPEVLPAEEITQTPVPIPVIIPAQAVADEAPQPVDQAEVPRPPDVTINIGRIVVSTPTTASTKPVQTPPGNRTRNPVASLGEYLERRDS